MASHDVQNVHQQTDFSSEQKSELVNRIIASQPFNKSPQLRGFLLFVVDRALTNRIEDINEYEIGRTVFGRRAAFDPHDDTIVRVQARRLRTKLEEYFAGPGKEELLVVTIPKRSYVPKFESRTVEPAPAPTPQQEESASPPPAPSGHPSRWRIPGMIAALLTVFMAGFSIAAFWRSEPAAAAYFKNPILARLFSNGAPKIVLSDSGVASLQGTIRRTISVDEYLQPDYPHALTGAIRDVGFRSNIERLARWQLTNYSDSSTVSQMVLLGQRHGMPVVLRHPRQISRHDFEVDSFVLLGGRLANPWYRLFEPRLNFVFDSDPVSGVFFVRNRDPRAGEEKEYHATSMRDGEETFSVLSLLPNLRNTGYVLLLAGINLQGTEGAADTVLRDDIPETLQSVWGNAERQDGYFEVLLKVRSIGGIPRDTSVVASRMITAKSTTAP